MADPADPSSLSPSFLKSLFSPKLTRPTFRTRRSMDVVYAFTFIFVACTTLYVFNNPSINHSPILLTNILKDKSQFSAFFSRYFNLNNTSQNPYISTQYSRKTNGFSKKRSGSSLSQGKANTSESDDVSLNRTTNGDLNKSFKPEDLKNVTRKTDENRRKEGKNIKENSKSLAVKNDTKHGGEYKSKMENSSSSSVKFSDGIKATREENVMLNHTALQKRGSAKGKEETWWKKMSRCNIFDGEWVKDDSYPLYEPGSCPHIDEPFNCHLNGRPDHGYEKFRWQPKHCNIPRLNGKKMLKLLRGKRLVYVGDSLNRNMWQSMVCLLRNSVKSKSKVFEVSGRHEFRKEGAYSFVFEDYNCSVEFIRSPFLVQEWEMQEKNGSKKDTLRLDLVERSSDKYKDADILVFNTGHWWTHEKTSAGEAYYQEGSHVYSKLDVVEAFRKAMTTWARWIEGNIDPRKTHVFFRGYSVSHFSGGEWYSGGKCHTDIKPIKDEKDLSPNLYPPIMGMLENVLKGMKTPVFYLNITRISDFRKDAHPSVYRESNMTEHERQSLLRHQDCSHWCLPGVPDTWNELLYAQLLMKHRQKERQEHQKLRNHKV